MGLLSRRKKKKRSRLGRPPVHRGTLNFNVKDEDYEDRRGERYLSAALAAAGTYIIIREIQIGAARLGGAVGELAGSAWAGLVAFFQDVFQPGVGGGGGGGGGSGDWPTLLTEDVSRPGPEPMAFAVAIMAGGMMLRGIPPTEIIKSFGSLVPKIST